MQFKAHENGLNQASGWWKEALWELRRYLGGIQKQTLFSPEFSVRLALWLHTSIGTFQAILQIQKTIGDYYRMQPKICQLCVCQDFPLYTLFSWTNKEGINKFTPHVNFSEKHFK